jgi:hypothetical protein
VYAPALVAWVGGPHFGGAVGANVGWFPLGPREVYVPAYPVSRRYVTNINVTNTRVETTVVNNYYTNVVVNKQVNVTNVTYVNQRVNGAVTATSGATFVSGQSVSRNVVRVDQREIVSTHAVAGAPAIAPTRQTYIGAGRPAAIRPPAAIATRTVVAKAPPPPPPVSFDRQQAAIRANGGRPLATAQYHQLAPPATQAAAHNNVRIAPVARTVTPVQPKSNNVAARPGQPPLNNNNSNNAVRPGQPVNAPPNNANAANPANAHNYNNRPPAARPVNVPANNPQVDQQHQQQLEKLRTQQDAERQRLEQQQIQQQQKVQAQANAQKQQQLNQKQNQQLENLERKHDTQAQKLQEKQVNDKGANKPPPSQNNNKDNNKQNKNNR